jgi:hypothetical protein
MMGLIIFQAFFLLPLLASQTKFLTGEMMEQLNGFLLKPMQHFLELKNSYHAIKTIMTIHQ